MHWSTLEELTWLWALKTWNPGIGNWNPHPLVHPSFIPFQCWCKCHHPKSLMSLAHHHMMLWWCHDLFWQESLQMHLVNWVGIVSLSRDTKVDALITLFMKGKMTAPGTYLDSHLQVPQCTPALSQPGYIFIKICRKSIICTGRYKVSKTSVCTKLKHLWVSIYMTSSGFWVEFVLISQQGEWHFRKTSWFQVLHFKNGYLLDLQVHLGV